MNDALLSCDPAHNATVKASAGSGKTWLLVARLMRLLLAGAAPDAILAVTFTRKAAAEMQSRLTERLRSLANADTTALAEQLQAIGAHTDETTSARARGLYERLLRAQHGVRITTFHAFSQDILRRFPLEANVPAGFDLVEDTSLLEQEAWDALFEETTRAPDSTVAVALGVLFQGCAGLSNTHAALRDFLHHRSDWWAYCADQRDPVGFASDRLRQALQLTATGEQATRLFDDALEQDLREFAELLSLHTTKTNLADAAILQAVLERVDWPDEADRRLHMQSVFLTQQLQPRARKPSKTQAKAMGMAGEARFLVLHTQLCDRLLTHLDELARAQAYAVSTAWFQAGERYLWHYQHIKLRQRLLDFSDLEWKAHELLNDGDNAHWIQFKLDQRVDHLLVDEFQDTNPTQWNLLLPLLQELAAGSPERNRSVFIVGDSKQSIYRFRRADPGLFAHAEQWLQAHLSSYTQPLNVSWRSSPAIIRFVNRVFEAGPLAERIGAFDAHQTHHEQRWGRVEVLPLTETDGGADQVPAGMRNPLTSPRVVTQDRRHLEEGRTVARRILALVAEGPGVDAAGGPRPLDYSDIIILMRNRTHARHYEQALREAGIPYVGTTRGTLLETMEIGDMLALLDVLVAPYDNLAAATVLRSPLFGCSDDQLIMLARQARSGHGPAWMELLPQTAAAEPADSALRRAAAHLQRWSALTGELPVHDLLDRIYSEGNVLARYEAAVQPHLRERVAANLTRFLELALEIDSGRYPSLMQFRDQLRQLRRHAPDATDEAPHPGATARVRLMTIHAAKGLEGNVVFLVDATSQPRGARNYEALIEWPTGQARPTHYQLLATSKSLDQLTRARIDEQDRLALREDANLLYVALTRARHMLVVSGCRPQRSTDLGWYGLIRDRLETEEGAGQDTLTFSWGQAPPGMPVPPSAPVRVDVDPGLTRPIPLPAPEFELAPSRQSDRRGAYGETGVDEDAYASSDWQGRQRGLLIHRILQAVAGTAPSQRAQLRVQLADELRLPATTEPFVACWREAINVCDDPQHRDLFNPGTYLVAYNEVPINYQIEGRRVHGLIDRLVVSDQRIEVVDYKTHPDAQSANATQLAERYREQLYYYIEGVRRLWPGKKVVASILFTACSHREPLQF